MDLAELFQEPRPPKKNQTGKMITEILSALITLTISISMIIFIFSTHKKY